MMATPFTAMSSTSLVVQREKRRRRKVTSPSKIGRKPRRGFKFTEKKDCGNSQEPLEATPVGKRKPGTPAKENTFVFRVRKDDEKDVSKQYTMDTDAVSAALRAKQEKMKRAEMRRLVRQKKREEATREALNEEEMKHKKLSADQISLYHLVQRQVKRELRKVRKEYLTSVARQDIMQLSETSLQAMKHELISFMAENSPGNVAIQVPNPENTRMRAAIEAYEQQMKSLEDEERQWLEMKATLEADMPSALNEATTESSSEATATHTTITQEGNKVGENTQKEELSCELKVTRSIEALQRSALQQLGSTTEKLALLDASMSAVNRWIVEAETKKARLFGAYHDSAFKGYGNMAQPKESLRALLELPARGGVP
ncbi:unnamed protein product [Peronospora belbahrii]|uniref:Uncharacterized protein n=1 Tax=Peronospora belbahrii TaxID=622444 RepID=A0AAU9LGB6_9STRA|nr:unnamed protein product [Peronospora belbahrii]CAH0514332.1 unnamed protein product [Peronospora belbahrii]